MHNDKQYFRLESHETLFPEEFECTLIGFGGSKADIPVNMILTDFRCMLITKNHNLELDIPFGYINKCQTSTQLVNKMYVCYVEMNTKFNIGFKVKSTDVNISKVVDYVNRVIGMEFVFAERLGSILNNKDKKCPKWTPIHDLEIKDSSLYDNHNRVYLSLYPQQFRVPRPFIGKRSPVDRMIIFSFGYEGKSSLGLWRSGPGRSDPQEEEWIPKAVKSKDHLVIEVKNRTLGSIKSMASYCFEMDGPVQLRQSFAKMYTITYLQSDPQKWLSNVNSCRWYEQIEILLSNTNIILEKFLQDINITILSEWDARASQIAALVEILCKPEYRTFEGLGLLIEKQFLHYGNYIPVNASKKQRIQDKGIALIQFLDCVYQLMCYYPLSFEFNEDYLTFIAMHIYSKKYGNFLYFTKCLQDKEEDKSQTLLSIWADIEPNKQKFRNGFYVSREKCEIFQLRRQISMKSYRLWSSLFTRNIFIYSEVRERNPIRNQYRIINRRHQEVQASTQHLRKQISTQHKTITSLKQQIKELKDHI